MAVDYYVQFPCKVRAAVSDVELLRMEKSRNRAHSVLEAMRRNPQTDRSKPESEWTVVVKTMGPQGPTDTTFKLHDLLKDSAPLDALAANCRGCKANLQTRDFGCGGAIHYPITASAERWLISRLPDDLDRPRGRLLVRAFKELDVNGGAIDESRGRKELYEAARPVERKWGGSFFSRTRVTSSQILHMLIGVGSLEAEHAKLIAYILGFMTDAFALDDAPKNQPSVSDEPRIAELKRFLTAGAFAGQHGVKLLVDA
jgi:hypothetical protein